MSIIKPKRGTGSPAGSIDTNEIAMDTAAQVLYVSTDGSDAIQLADDSRNYLENVSYFLADFNAGGYPQTAVLGNNKISTYGAQNASIEIKTGQFAAGANKGPVKIDATKLDMDSNPIDNIDSTTFVSGVNPTIKWANDYNSNAAQTVEDNGGSEQENAVWYKWDNQYLGQFSFKKRSAGNHQFRLATFDQGIGNWSILRHEKYVSGVSDGYTVLSNGGNNGELSMTEDKCDLSYRLDIFNGRTNSGSGLSPHALFCQTDMSQDATLDIMNSATFNTVYGTQTKRNGMQNSISFGIENDADGYEQVGRISAVYDSNGLENKLRMQSNNEAGTGANTLEGGSVVGSGNGKANITCLSFNTNVPVKLPEYTVAQLGSLNSQNGMQVYCTDGDAGSPCLAVYDGLGWKRVALGAAVSTT